MKSFKQRGLGFLLAAALLVGVSAPAHAAVSDDTLASAVDDAAAYMYKTVKSPQVGSIGGEWAVLGLARSGYEVPKEYYQDYYATVEAYVKACGGILHTKKYTEYSRVIVALSSIGKDARNVAGYDLTKALGDFEKTIWQGINGPIWALIALDAGSYPMPQNPGAATQATRQMYVDEILSRQLADGGWSLNGVGGAATPSDPDITGMALQALAKYQDQSAVAKATQDALACMSKMQGTDGGFSSWGNANLESSVQMLVALCELGVSIDDSRFVKNGKTILDNVMSFYRAGAGFLHTLDGSGSNQMATEQGFYALAAVQRGRAGKNSLYRMGDALSIPDAVSASATKGAGLGGKHADVKTMPVTAPGKTFADIVSSPNITAIEALATRGIINGKSNGNFDPEGSMTRSEFAKIVVVALGLPPGANDKFPDVAVAAWYASYVGAANAYGIVNGGSDGSFNPLGTISRQETAVMAANAAKLCGMDITMDTGAVRDMLSQFPDYTASAAWAQPALAFCYREEILSQGDADIRPTEPVTRGEVAQMLFNLLDSANLL
ncbi:conserved exported hypothetical protein [uncultured Eubacteriales bacterium]|uniref:SLH domain-containing protein n=1 Tax=uncultured Eubacteriales bacterium TaxID=172733 RepID=A0A212JZD5_9FIRM|nr:conserved exported hypothetical protein [uncultured Eubacteriales bacterium]